MIDLVALVQANRSSLDAAKTVLEIIALLGTVIAIPWVSFRFLADLSGRRRQRDAELYAAVDRSVQDSLALAIAHPKLAVGPYELAGAAGALSAEEQMQQWLLYDHVTSTFENCFLTYRQLGHDPEMQRQWSAWKRYMTLYCRKPSYRAWLEMNGLTKADGKTSIYDPAFDAEISALYEATR
ncbi:MAG TPA: hypothetical protein PLN53_07835 [Terricaulis sp.]|nr:hypothetical protein [Terricaulis sp.]